VLFGPNHLYVFHHPKDASKNQKDGKPEETPTFDSANEEIAEKAGLVRHDGSSSGMNSLFLDYIKIIFYNS
jgi:hypothetical protein